MMYRKWSIYCINTNKHIGVLIKSECVTSHETEAISAREVVNQVVNWHILFTESAQYDIFIPLFLSYHHYVVCKNCTHYNDMTTLSRNHQYQFRAYSLIAVGWLSNIAWQTTVLGEINPYLIHINLIWYTRRHDKYRSWHLVVVPRWTQFKGISNMPCFVCFYPGFLFSQMYE